MSESTPNPNGLPAVLNVHKVALDEISYIVGNEDTLDSLDCAAIRAILMAALNDGAKDGFLMRSDPSISQEWRRRRAGEGRGDDH